MDRRNAPNLGWRVCDSSEVGVKKKKGTHEGGRGRSSRGDKAGKKREGKEGNRKSEVMRGSAERVKAPCTQTKTGVPGGGGVGGVETEKDPKKQIGERLESKPQQRGG